MFISWTRSLDKVTLTPQELEGITYLMSLTGGEYTRNILSNLTYVGNPNSNL